MIQRSRQNRFVGGRTWPALMVVLLAGLCPSLQAGGGPVDVPPSSEPRVPLGHSLTESGLVASEGTYQPFVRIHKGEAIHSRDLLVALPGFKVVLQPENKASRITLWGNLPGLSESPVLESSIILHDSRAYDLDMTLLGGRVVLTNTRKEGPARIWIRGESGVQLILPEPGDTISLESYGRWPRGAAFVHKRKDGIKPVRVWQIYCLKGKVEIKALRTEWLMAAPPGLAYFHGDSVDGPSASGPEKRDTLPDWWTARTTRPKLAKLVESVIDTYTGKFKTSDPDQVATEILAAADKDTNKIRARVMRYLVVHAMGAIDEIEKVAEFLEQSKYEEKRAAAVVALRHWIGAREGRDDKLFTILHQDLNYTKAEAETLMQLLHSPFDPNQPETYETLIAYLKHRKQAVRELAHWHLVRLAPIGQKIPFDASAPDDQRDKAVAAWKALIPAGELPREGKPDDTKKPAAKE
ncbi:MAG: hypothetical protein U0840_03130 [Gemmataceae bacterium]